MKHKRLLFPLLVCGVMLAFAACAGETAPEELPAASDEDIQVEPPPASPEDLPMTEDLPGLLSSFTTTDLTGADADQSLLAAYDLVMVNVWATYCGPCLVEMPDLGQLAAEYADQGFAIWGLVIDTLNSDGSLSEAQVDIARDIVAETGADYLHILPSASLMDLVSQITVVPTTFFVDSQGNQVGGAYTGSRSKEDWAEIIDTMLAEVGE